MAPGSSSTPQLASLKSYAPGGVNDNIAKLTAQRSAAASQSLKSKSSSGGNFSLGFGNESSSSSEEDDSESDADADLSFLQKLNAKTPPTTRSDANVGLGRVPRSRDEEVPESEDEGAKVTQSKGAKVNGRAKAVSSESGSSSSESSSDSSSDSEAAPVKSDNKAQRKVKQKATSSSSPTSSASESDSEDSDSDSVSSSGSGAASEKATTKTARASNSELNGVKPRAKFSMPAPISSDEDASSSSSEDETDSDEKSKVKPQARTKSKRSSSDSDSSSESDSDRRDRRKASSTAKAKGKGLSTRSSSSSDSGTSSQSLDSESSDVEEAAGSSAVSSPGVRNMLERDFVLQQAAGGMDAKKLAKLVDRAAVAGKLVWMFTAPARVPVSLVEEFAIPVPSGDASLFSTGGQDFTVSMGAVAKKSTIQLTLDKSREEFKIDSPAASPKPERVMHVKKVTMLPENTTQISQVTITTHKIPRPQPEGLKGRFQPIGVGGGSHPQWPAEQGGTSVIQTTLREVEMEDAMVSSPEPVRRKEKKDKIPKPKATKEDKTPMLDTRAAETNGTTAERAKDKKERKKRDKTGERPVEPALEPSPQPSPEPAPVEKIRAEKKSRGEKKSKKDKAVEKPAEPTPEPSPRPSPEPAPVEKAKVAKKSKGEKKTKKDEIVVELNAVGKPQKITQVPLPAIHKTQVLPLTPHMEPNTTPATSKKKRKQKEALDDDSAASTTKRVKVIHISDDEDAVSNQLHTEMSARTVKKEKSTRALTDAASDSIPPDTGKQRALAKVTPVPVPVHPHQSKASVYSSQSTNLAMSSPSILKAPMAAPAAAMFARKTTTSAAGPGGAEAPPAKRPRGRPPKNPKTPPATVPNPPRETAIPFPRPGAH